MRKSRLSLTRPFSLREGTKFSGRNILPRHKKLSSLLTSVDNNEGNEMELQDEMNDNVDNSEENEENVNNYDEETDYNSHDGNEEENNYEEETDYNHHDGNKEENDDNYREETDYNYHEESNYSEENVYYDDSSNVEDKDELEDDYNMEEDNVIDESDNHEDTIVDSSIGCNHMLNIDGRFAPYFENSTFALLFCWIQKHNISTHAYNDLVEVLHHQNFKVKDVVKIQRIYTYNELQNNFHSNSRSITKESQLWMVDQYLKEGSIIANTYEIIRKVNIMIIRETNTTDGIFIKEILYKSNGYWKMRNVTLDYKHPGEYFILSLPPLQYRNLRVLKIFIDIYYDDFSTYRNVYHSLGGVYVQLGNMPFDIRKLVRNHFVLGFIPFGGCFEDFIRPFIKDMKRLEKGTLMNI
ncbi:hypothetical protein GLOIN_2v1886404 [Rhizophagus irregularis DAOM 181602=DAOM 197198]|uniref:Uncharacterized protein n=2 Tax=Rhizophagus irregularis TaxID=588596 RepID=A0A2P4NWZ3_RHIID|nr:hypothetical protein GLOIN_2v1886404 [Rhizophagus irregularis DAOM 181602=DAOM 197198]POG57656.1 hypothetical protein GLOIN_2v1886404 [Rhizophagus irregularis DAOM 181602=DAOM 197198]|eukprot:XP_025164522.1 hypothetical protein GLOIN_2v1886404 [Rhizophagus irregularis DAOM 181602=DAOM 197198]